MSSKQPAHGFTLIELMVVVTIMGILMAIAIPQYNNYVRKSAVTEATGSLSDARIKMEQYFQDNRTYQGTGGAGTCGVANFTTSNFAFTCVSANSGQTFTFTATGTDKAAGFVYTIDEQNRRGTTAIPSDWGSAPADAEATGANPRWITSKP